MGTAVIFSNAMAYSEDSQVCKAEEEFEAMSREWTTEELRPHWDYVVNPVPEDPEARKWHDEVRDNGHEGWSLEAFTACSQARLARLSQVHVVALRLYTGPGYTYINGDLRELKGEFKVTIKMCMAAITMLANAAVEVGNPPKLFFRGLKGALDQHFVDSYRAMLRRPPGDALQFLLSLAVCDLALMSTTTDASVAAENFGGNIIFVLSPMPASYTDGNFPFKCLPCGAEVGWLSQYPQEAEWMWPCGTTLYPVPRSERLAALLFHPPEGKLVLQLYALAPQLRQHPKASHVFYLAEEEQKAASDFAAARASLKHNFSSTTYGGLESILIDTLFGKIGIDDDDIAATFSPLALQDVPGESAALFYPSALVPVLERFYQCYCDVRAAEAQDIPEGLKNCIDICLAEWRALPQDVDLDYAAYNDTWASMQRAVIQKIKASKQH